jgi:hypothetical protein
MLFYYHMNGLNKKKMVTPQSPSFLELLSHEHIRISWCSGSHSEHRYIITKLILILKTVSYTCFVTRCNSLFNPMNIFVN